MCSDLDDGLQQVQYKEVGLGGQIPADHRRLVQLGRGPEEVQVCGVIGRIGMR